MNMQFKMDDQDRKRIILTLRWTAIIVTSYLILFGRGRVTDLHLSHILIAIYILSNILLYLLSEKMVFKHKILLSISPLRHGHRFIRNVSFGKDDDRFLSCFFLNHHLCIDQSQF